MREQVFQAGRGDRSFIPNFAILVTGQPPSLNKEGVVPQGVKARIEGTLMYVITVSDVPLEPVDELRLRGIANEPHRYFRLNMSGVDELDRRVDEVVGAICNGNLECVPSFLVAMCIPHHIIHCPAL